MTFKIKHLYYTNKKQDYESKTSFKVQEEISDKEVGIFPNPNNGNFFLFLNGEKEQSQLEIFDLNGKLVTSRTFDNLSGHYILPMELSYLEKGLYSVQVQVGAELSTKKLIVQ